MLKTKLFAAAMLAAALGLVGVDHLMEGTLSGWSQSALNSA